MHPLAIAAVPASLRRRDLPRIAVDPFRNVEIEKLLAPDHAGEGLALNELGICDLDVALQIGVELIGLRAAQIDEAFEVGEGFRSRQPRQAQPD